MDKDNRDIGIGVADLKPRDVHAVIIDLAFGIEVPQPRRGLVIMQALMHLALGGAVRAALSAVGRRDPFSFIHMDIYCRS
ncbi:hypothetical protein CAT723_05260 [Corynebacterium ammoniagenes]|uniref:Uncharacterized protein n=1 Tax=Corynebacterium ammoniagenes TaxID=1697 RepID=A0AAV5G4J7_CORAM|nr:hypothetical protein CAT723_05260 [Corynebacterium ammoniagenes]